MGYTFPIKESAPVKKLADQIKITSLIFFHRFLIKSAGARKLPCSNRLIKTK